MKKPKQPKAKDETNPKQILRSLTRGVYAIQKLRIQMGNRLCQAFRVRLGIKSSEKEDEIKNKDAKIILDALRAAFKKLTDGVAADLPTMQKFSGNEIISTYTELCLVAQYLSLEKDEDKHFRRIDTVLQQFPIYEKFLKGVRGCGAAMSAVIISEIDIFRAEYPSSIWKYSGLDVAQDGAGRSRRKEHLIRVKYQDKNKKTKERDSITFNPFLKTKLYVLAGCFLKSKSPYRQIYDDYKHRLETMPQHAEKKPGHRHAMATRYMLKMFLKDLYNQWRPLENLPVAPTYLEAKEGKKHKEAA